MEEFIRFSEDNLWTEIWPELTLAMGAVLILLIDLFSSKEKNKGNICGAFAVFFQACLLIYHLLDYLLINHTFDRSSFSGMLRHGFQGDVIRTFFLLSSLCVSILGVGMENLLSQGVTLMVIGMATVFAFLVLLIGAMRASAAYFKKYADRFEEAEKTATVQRGGDVEVAIAIAAIRAKRG